MMKKKIFNRISIYSTLMARDREKSSKQQKKNLYIKMFTETIQL